jgi:hypothetical protein
LPFLTYPAQRIQDD